MTTCVIHPGPPQTRELLEKIMTNMVRDVMAAFDRQQTVEIGLKRGMIELSTGDLILDVAYTGGIEYRIKSGRL